MISPIFGYFPSLPPSKFCTPSYRARVLTSKSLYKIMARGSEACEKSAPIKLVGEN